MGPNFSELDVKLRETDRRRDEVLDDVRAKLVDIPGFTFGVKQFISERIEEVLSGTTATIAIKVFGPDLEVLRRKAVEIRVAAARVDGIEDLNLPSQSLIPTVRLIFDREAMANQGLSSADIAAAVRTAFYGDKISQVFEQQRAFDIVVRLNPEAGRDLATMGQLLIDTPLGGKVPLESVARLVMDESPGVIDRENAQRCLAVTCNVGEGSLSEVVRQAATCGRAARSSCHPDTSSSTAGNTRPRARRIRQISILTIAAVAGIFMLLCLAFRSVGQSLLVMANLPLALIGGVAAVLIANAGHTSVASLVGFVSLFGIATRNGIMLVTHYNHLVRERRDAFWTRADRARRMERLSPILMTAMTAGLALLPLAIAVGRPGRELEQPMAVVILGGLVTSTLLNLLVLPALYLKFGRRLLLLRPNRGCAGGPVRFCRGSAYDDTSEIGPHRRPDPPSGPLMPGPVSFISVHRLSPLRRRAFEELRARLVEIEPRVAGRHRNESARRKPGLAGSRLMPNPSLSYERSTDHPVRP